MREFTKIYVPLSRDEFVALSQSAQHELRDPREQARYILRSFLLGKTLPTNTNTGSVDRHPDQAVAA